MTEPQQDQARQKERRYQTTGPTDETKVRVKVRKKITASFEIEDERIHKVVEIASKEGSVDSASAGSKEETEKNKGIHDTLGVITADFVIDVRIEGHTVKSAEPR